MCLPKTLPHIDWPFQLVSVGSCLLKNKGSTTFYSSTDDPKPPRELMSPNDTQVLQPGHTRRSGIMNEYSERKKQCSQTIHLGKWPDSSTQYPDLIVICFFVYSFCLYANFHHAVIHLWILCIMPSGRLYFTWRLQHQISWSCFPFNVTLTLLLRERRCSLPLNLRRSVTITKVMLWPLMLRHKKWYGFCVYFLGRLPLESRYRASRKQGTHKERPRVDVLFKSPRWASTVDSPEWWRRKPLKWFLYQLLTDCSHLRERTSWLSPVNPRTVKTNEKVVVVLSHLVWGWLIVTAIDSPTYPLNQQNINVI